MINYVYGTSGNDDWIERALYDKCVMRLSDICSELSDFLEDHFRGAYKLTSSSQLIGKAYISVRALADIIEALLCDAFGKTLVNIDVVSCARRLTLTISADGHSFQHSCDAFPSEALRNGGIEISYSQDTVELSCEVLKLPIFNVRTLHTRELYDALARSFGINMRRKN